MKAKIFGASALVLAAFLPTAASADVTIGVIAPTTGSTAALGIPVKNSMMFFPDEIGGEKLKVILVDDASDPTMATTLARKLITEDKADVLVGSVMTGAAIAVAGVALESEVVQLSLSPINLPPGRDTWTFRMPQQVALMAEPVFEHMAANKVKTVGFIGFSDAWGDFWLKELQAAAAPRNLKIVAEERYARADTSVTGQALKLVAARPDAILVGASGTAAALPQLALRERGYKGLVYQTHGAATQDLIRIGGAAVEGAVLPTGPMLVPEQLPDSSVIKKPGLEYVAKYEEKFGAGTRTQFGGHLYDSIQVLKRVIPVALKSAKPGTKEFRTAIKTALESEKDIVAAHGVYNFTKDDHFGLDRRGRELLTIKDGKWLLLK